VKRALLLFAAMLTFAAPAVAADLQSFGRGSWQALLEAHEGRPTVVHFWGLTCGPCLVELPEWGKLLGDRPEMTLVTIAADPSPMRPEALSMALDKAGLARADNRMFDGMSERLRFEVDPSWQGELPMTVLIGADGSVQTTIGEADLSAIRSWLEAQERRG
jgi:thiol-disulfide isomerase/thioredoxin